MKAVVHIVPILRDNYCYLVEGENKECIVIDPGQTAPVQHALQTLNLRPVLILNTHHHADHVAGDKDLKTAYGISATGPKAEMPLIPSCDTGVSEGDMISQSGLEFQVIDTPGHTLGHVAFYLRAAQALFCGDTLFSMGCGRLMEGSPAQMWNSLNKLKSLPDDTNIYCGHEYTETNAAFALSLLPGNEDILRRQAEVRKLRINGLPSLPVTLEREKKTNPFLMAGNVEEFTARRAAKDSF